MKLSEKVIHVISKIGIGVNPIVKCKESDHESYTSIKEHNNIYLLDLYKKISLIILFVICSIYYTKSANFKEFILSGFFSHKSIKLPCRNENVLTDYRYSNFLKKY